MVGQQIRSRRLEAGMRQRELGARVGIAQSRISQIEREDGKGVTVDLLERIAEVFGCDRTDLITRKAG